jgi:hypothetical protein
MTRFGRFGITLASNELALTAEVSAQHRSLLATYRMNGHRGENAARDRILEDLRNFLDLGALDRATDLLIVLALHPRESGRHARRLALATARQRGAICLQRWRGFTRAQTHPAKGRGVPFKAIEAPHLDGLGAEPPAQSLDGEDADRPC